MNEVNMDYYATAGYDNPWKQENLRRNEIWLLRKNSNGFSRFDKDKITSTYTSDSSAESKEEGHKSVPDHVVDAKHVSILR